MPFALNTVRALAHRISSEVWLMAFSTGSSSTSSEINVTPLIDVLLVLLIIFMVIGPTLPHGIDSATPQRSKGSADSLQQAPIVVQVLAGPSGVRYRVGEREATLAELQPMLRQIFAARPLGTESRALFVQGDRSLSFDTIARVVGEARAAEASPVALLGKP
jgi:biopolymer transport protein TolR